MDSVFTLLFPLVGFLGFAGLIGIPARAIQLATGNLRKYFVLLTHAQRAIVAVAAVMGAVCAVAWAGIAWEAYAVATCTSNCAQGGFGLYMVIAAFGIAYLVFEILLSPLTLKQLRSAANA